MNSEMTYWGHRTTVQKSNHIKWQVDFGTGENRRLIRGPPGPGAKKRTNKLDPHVTPNLGVEPGATLVGFECSHHCAIPAPC